MKLKPTCAGAMVVSLLVLVILLFADGTEARRRQYHSCALCRLARNDYTNIFGRRWSEFDGNQCSEWYPENIEPEHEHVWQRSSSMAGFNFFGRKIWISDSDRPAGLMLLTPAEQMAVYQHIPNNDEAKRLLMSMRDDAESGDRSRYPSVHSKSRILRDWVHSSFAESWVEIKPELRDP